MDKETILAQSRKDNQVVDERDRKISNQASIWGALGMGFVLVAVFLIRLIAKQAHAYDLLAIGFGYGAAANAYVWHMTKEKRSLVEAVLSAVLALGWLWVYFIEG